MEHLQRNERKLRPGDIESIESLRARNLSFVHEGIRTARRRTAITRTAVGLAAHESTQISLATPSTAERHIKLTANYGYVEAPQ